MLTRVSAGVDDCLCFSTFITMIPIDCKITNYCLYVLVTISMLTISLFLSYILHGSKSI